MSVDLLCNYSMIQLYCHLHTFKLVTCITVKQGMLKLTLLNSKLTDLFQFYLYYQVDPTILSHSDFSNKGSLIRFDQNQSVTSRLGFIVLQVRRIDPFGPNRTGTSLVESYSIVTVFLVHLISETTTPVGSCHT